MDAFFHWRLILLPFSCLAANWLPFLAHCQKLEAKLKLWGLRKFGKHNFCFVMVMFLSFLQNCAPGSVQWCQSPHLWGLSTFEVSSLYSCLDLKPQKNHCHSLYPDVHWLKRAQHSISQVYYLWSFGSHGFHASRGRETECISVDVLTKSQNGKSWKGPLEIS